MENIERIINAKNRVFQASFSLGKDNPISLKTDDKHIYRVTGLPQINDIMDSGFVRPPLGKAKGGHTGEVFWTQGEEKLFYYDKRPVLETSIDSLKDNGQKGAISLDELTGIWVFDEKENRYVNNIEDYRLTYNQAHTKEEQITGLKDIISAYNNQISTLLSDIKPFVEQPEISNRLSTVIQKNNEINSSQVIDSINDYKKVVNIKKTLVSYLEKLNTLTNDYTVENQNSTKHM